MTEKSPHWRRVLSRYYSEKIESALRADIRRERRIIALASFGILGGGLLYVHLPPHVQLIVDVAVQIVDFFA